MTEWARPALPAQWTGAARLPPFVGRRRELEGLEAIWASVEGGARQVVFVGGEPGAGKSRLAAEAASALDRNGVSVLVGSCTAELGLPFDPFVQPVRTLLPVVDAGQLTLEGEGVVNPDEARDLLRLLTEGHTRGARPTAGALAPIVFEAVVALLRDACTARPLLLVLEDLHWAGESALRILRFVVERTAELPMLVVATYRSNRPDRSDPLSEVMADLMRVEGVHRLDLQGLDTGEVADYLTVSHAGNPEEVRHGAALLRDSTGGNPFVLREVWRDLEGRGGLISLASGEIAPPDSLRAVIAARLSALEAAQRELVSLGAVIGETFSINLIHAVAGSGVTAAEVFAAMRAASAAGLVQPATGGAGVMRFEHALARQAVLEAVDPFDLASAHAQVGLALEAGFAAEESRVQRLSHHFSSAPGLGLDDRAVRYLEQAAQIAADRLANSDAAALFERAATHTQDGQEADRLRLAAARCYHLAARMSRARELDEQVATQGHPTQRLAAAIGYEAASWRSGINADRAVGLLLAGLEGVESSGPVTSSWDMLALGALSRALSLGGRRDEAVALHQRAEAAAREAGDERLLLAVLHKGITLQTDIGVGAGLDRLHRQVALAEEVTEIATRRQELRPLGAASQMRTFAAYVLGDTAAMEAAAEDLARMVRATSQPYWRWSMYLVAASRSIMRCEFADARHTIATSWRLERTFGDGRLVGEGPSSLQSFMVRRETGGLEFARRVLAGTAVTSNPWRPGLVAVLTELGMPEPTSEALKAALEQDLPRLKVSATWPAALSFLADAAVWLGDRDAMEQLLVEAEPFVGLNLMGAEFLAVVGSGDRLVAQLKSGTGRPGVEEHFAAALAMDERMGSTLHVATTHAEWAAHLSRVGASSARVEDHAGPARELADRYELVRVRRILGPLAHAGRPSLPDGLTARELDVLRLIGRGVSNRGIATQLVISEYTAANHVRSILMKTQCANRTAAAHYAMEHGLLASASRDGRE
ncbi:MAG: AAA family ATPase [Pedococcus sp.]